MLLGILREDNQEQEKVEPHRQVLIHLHMDLMSAVLLEITCMAAMNFPGGTGRGKGVRSDTDMQSIVAFYLKRYLTYIEKKYWI